MEKNKTDTNASSAARIGWLTDYLKLGKNTDADIMDIYHSKFDVDADIGAAEFKIAKKEANEYYQNYMFVRKASDTSEMQRELAVRAKRKENRQTKREMLVDKNLEIIQKGYTPDSRIINGEVVIYERPITPYELASLENATNAILAELSKIDGDYPTAKQEFTIKAGTIDTFILED